jgi:hypothetical protein
MAREYPSTLPAPSSDGYSFSVEPTVNREQMDSGRFRQVRKTTAQYHFVNLSWKFTDSEYQVFREFYTATIEYGAQWFEIALAFGDGLKTNTARFVGGYSASNSGILNWTVTARLQLEGIDEIDTQGELETAGAGVGLVGTAWVDVLPRPNVSFSTVVESATVQTGTSESRYKARNRFYRSVYISSVDWLLSDAQMEFFKGWHKVILELGCNPFTLELPLGDGYGEYMCRFVDGVFSAAYMEGGNWNVSAQIECEKRESGLQYYGGLLDLSTATYRTSDGNGATASAGAALDLATATYRTSNGASPAAGDTLDLSTATYNSGS